MQKNGTKKVKQSWDNRFFSWVTMLIILLLTALCIIPFIYLLAVSLSGSDPVMRGEVFLFPKEFSLDVYVTIFENGSLVKAMGRSILLTIAYTLLALVMTVMCAYPLSVSGLKGKKILIPFIMFTMYFSGGLIPGYLLVSNLGLIDSYWALILPGALSTYNMLVMRTFFASIPISLKEAALMDGAGDLTILFKVVLPLSKASVATIALFYIVSRWNQMQDGLLYINDPSKTILQVKLKQMILNTNAIKELLTEGVASATENIMPVQTIRAGALIFSLIPIMVIYPFLQKYFVKGTMIGSVKG